MVTRNDMVRGVIVRGIDPKEEAGVSDIARQFKAGKLGNLEPDSFNIAIGSELARNLRIGPGDKLTVIIPQGQVTPQACFRDSSSLQSVAFRGRAFRVRFELSLSST